MSKRKRGFLIGLSLLVAVILMLNLASRVGARKPDPAKSAKAAAKGQQHSDISTPPDSAARTPMVRAAFRPLNFALLRGGFTSVSEFNERVKEDPTLHAFYGDCSDRNASMFALPEDITVFSTFRKGDQIKWAAKPLIVHKGEYVMTFCGKTVLARCGNLISVSPMQPSEDIPPAMLETPVDRTEPPLMLAANENSSEEVPPVGVASAIANAKRNRFFFVPPFYVPSSGYHAGPPASIVTPPTSTPPGVTPPSTPTPPPSNPTPPPPPIIPPPPSPPGHVSGDEFSGHQAMFTLMIGFFVIGLLKRFNR